MMWNKGNATFSNKKVEIEVIIEEYKPLCFGVIEANIESECHLPSLRIDQYNLELDGLWAEGLEGRVAIYINDEADYIRRADLEPPSSPSIWVEFNPGTAKAWLLLLDIESG